MGGTSPSARSRTPIARWLTTLHSLTNRIESTWLVWTAYIYPFCSMPIDGDVAGDNGDGKIQMACITVLSRLAYTNNPCGVYFCHDELCIVLRQRSILLSEWEVIGPVHAFYLLLLLAALLSAQINCNCHSGWYIDQKLRVCLCAVIFSLYVIILCRYFQCFVAAMLVHIVPTINKYNSR